MLSLSVSFQPPPILCDILIGKSLLDQALQFSSMAASNVFIFTTDEVAKFLPKTKVEKIILPSGESIKTRATKEKVENFLVEKGVGKDCALLAIGGGALLDLIGFVASTYCRGVPYISMPTTLLAMTDAAIGGKTAVNVEAAKNWIGSFYHPKKIFIDWSFLFSLPENEYVYGLSETVKHSLIADPIFYAFLEENLEKILKKDVSILPEMIFRSCMIKKRIVEEDPFENKGLRRILNFGHTVGHGLETFSNYSISHGQAVYMGMLVETAISMQKGFFPHSDWIRLQTLLKRLPLSLAFPKVLPFDFLLRDKKGAHQMVVLKEIGLPVSFQGIYTEKLSQKELQEGLDYVSSNY